MLHNPAVLLRDGTTLDDLMMRDTFEVSLRVISDEELYRIEMERIFAQSWLLLGHESEIPEPGDFIVRETETSGPFLLAPGNHRRSVGARHVEPRRLPVIQMVPASGDATGQMTFSGEDG